MKQETSGRGCQQVKVGTITKHVAPYHFEFDFGQNHIVYTFQGERIHMALIPPSLISGARIRCPSGLLVLY